tara:strand:- start:64 stop:240 length:177 start_codon:yes stop_codon:yes gene_type:complete
MKIVPCKNGVGEWEIDPTHETFDTYAEAEEHLRKLEDEMSLVNIVNELHKMLERRSNE